MVAKEDTAQPRPLLLLLIYLLSLHAIAIFFFTSGFLLTRTELPDASSCADIQKAPCAIGREGSSSCWSTPGVKRLVVLIIDALRFDFVADLRGEAQPWMEKLPVLRRLAKRASARLFKYVADPPTTTLQRLKGVTTGSLPTFIDVGNSFGAPAIVEDNLIQQLVQNGKRVVAMGDDTWLQLFPNHFSEAYPFPSFNVKDLHTVDNGVIANLFPTLERDDWDVVIGHFLGVDHVGHIFSVDSPLMTEKLEQYNAVIEKVVSMLQAKAYPGGPHEDTLFIVMGDHGQTLNGDHGGGTPEEVETALFAMRMHPETQNGTFKANGDIMELPQLDFAATIATLLGVPIPYGSVGTVNQELFSLGLPLRNGAYKWSERYRDVLCVNSWQVQRYLEKYAASGFGGIPARELSELNDVYNQARREEDSAKQREAYLTYLKKAASLARTQWTQFGGFQIGLGLFLLVLSIPVHFVALRRLTLLKEVIFPWKVMLVTGLVAVSVATLLSALTSAFPRAEVVSQFLKEHIGAMFAGSLVFGTIVAFLISHSVGKQELKFDSKTAMAVFFVGIQAVSLLSNSFILEEGHLASFLLAATGFLYLRKAFQTRKKLFQALFFLVVNRILSGVGLLNIVKDTHELRTTDSFLTRARDAIFAYMFPMLILMLLAGWQFRKVEKRIGPAAILALPYALVVLHWLSESTSEFSRLQLPRLVYASTIVTNVTTVLMTRTNYSRTNLRKVTATLLASSGATILLLLGRKGALIALLGFLQVWCLSSLQKSSATNFAAAAEWNLLAILLFFCSNHRCTFDGLRYPAAFIGFDDFNIYRQGVLLAVDTFGLSHIAAILGLPLLLSQGSSDQTSQLLNIGSVFLSFGLIRSVTTTFATICVTLQRRHLMVWGLFAPKYVFDAIGLLLTDSLLVAAAALYFPLAARSR